MRSRSSAFARVSITEFSRRSNRKPSHEINPDPHLVAFAYSGLYNVAVGTGHTAVTEWFLSTMRHRSVAVRADDLAIPGDLGQPARIRAGAEHYAKTCAGCHGRPGKKPSTAFGPHPPALYEHRHEPAPSFWIIRNGLKMSAMPSHSDLSDSEIWDIVAFLQRLPEITPAEYKEMTAAPGNSG